MKSRVSAAAVPISALILTFLASGFVFVQMVVNQISKADYAMHLILLRKWVNGKHYLPHPFFHFTTDRLAKITSLSPEWSAAIVLTTTCTASACIMYLVLRRFETKLPRPMSWSLLGAAFLFFTTPIYMPLLLEYHFLGQLSPTIWHNPTYIFMRPFALGTMVLFLVAYGERLRWHVMIACILCALASIVAKPSFIIMFLPAVICLLAIEALRPERRPKWTIAAFAAILIGLSVAILAWQFHNRFGAAGKSQIIIDPFAHWSKRSNNIPVSIIVALAFPLAYAIARPKSIWKDRALLLAWIMTIGSMVAYALFRDNEKAVKSNFGWSYCTTQGMLFLFTTVRWIDWKKQLPRSRAWWIVTFILAAHFISGIYYYIKIVSITSDGPAFR